MYTVAPLVVAESQGGMFGNDLVIFSGFSGRWEFATPKVFALDVTNRSATWREMDDVPIRVGITHSGHVVVNNTKFYMCGGYVGGEPYPVTSECFMYHHANQKGSQWTTIPSIPGKRSGGGMIHDQGRNSLIFATGASRDNKTDLNTTIDHSDVWELSLDNMSGGWKSKTNIPYQANHVGAVSVLHNGKQHHFFMGGQLRADEAGGNLDFVYEYNSTSSRWDQRAPLPVPRGHFSSSTVPDRNGCGFFVLGGAINGGKRTADVLYYSVANNLWMKLGEMPSARNTPVCGISADNYLYCQGGNLAAKFSWRHKLIS
jgi:N-acetylneuraminic acid mutarotase